MLSPQVQDALDRIRKTQSLVASYKQANDLTNQQNAALTAKVAELQGKLDAGGTINADDLGAIAEISSDIDLVNAQLQPAVLANTQPEGSGVAGSNTGATADPRNPPASLDPNGRPATGGTPQPATAPDGSAVIDDSADRGAEAAASTAKPLAGTGA